MKIATYISLIAGILLSFNLYSQEGIKQIREVSIINDSSKVIADIWMPEYKPKKLQADVVYAWYYRQEIHLTQSDFSGQVLHGEYKLFSKAGKLLIKGNYEKGLKTGVWKYWNSKGILLQTVSYKEGRKNGMHTLYYPNGDVKERRNYSKGVLHKKTEKYLKGQLASVTTYHMGEVKRVSYYENGKKKKVAKETKRKKKKKEEEETTLEPKEEKEKKQWLSKMRTWFKDLFKRKDKQEEVQSEDPGL